MTSIDVFTLFPSWFDWFAEQRHVRNASALGLELRAIDLRETTPLRAGQVDDTPYGGGAGMVIRVEVVEAALRERYGEDAAQVQLVRLRVVAEAAGVVGHQAAVLLAGGVGDRIAQIVGDLGE